ncbi:MAG: J domain-containing protein [Candidatus Sulfotelmatobacter sp.]
MPTDPSGFSDIKRAYELLGVPDSASTHVIKRAYRVMAKRWHPDLYLAGTPEQAEAARMMKHINEAYGTIQRAPLRYGTRGYTGMTPQQAKQAPTPINDIPVAPEHELVGMDKLEFWVRFVCGSILGIFVSVGVALRTNLFSADTPPIAVLSLAIAIVLACGFGAARGGDRFWYAIFGR